jgi:hypothetical protein
MLEVCWCSPDFPSPRPVPDPHPLQALRPARAEAHPGPCPGRGRCPWRTRLAPPPTFFLGVRVVYATPATPPPPYIGRATEPCTPRTSIRLGPLAGTDRTTAAAVLNPPAMEPTGANRGRREACDVHRPPWRRETTCAPPLHGRPSRTTATSRRRRITAASHRLSHR